MGAAISAALSISLLTPFAEVSSAMPDGELTGLAGVALTTDPMTGVVSWEVRPGVMRIVDDAIGDRV